MAVITITCQNCNSQINAQIGQNIANNKLVWHLSSLGSNCGTQLELDGFNDSLPKEMRQAILAQEGEYKLIVNEIDTNKTLALKILRHALGWSLSDVKKYQNFIPGTVITGTRAEMEWLKVLLSAQGLVTVVSNNIL